jgi:Asp-tRNA(Asn)/Glu-tRNA(Gln) amidotransferase A subunit family amidase
MLAHVPRAARVVAVLSLFLLVPIAVGSSGAAAAAPGTLTTAHFHSAAMGEDISYSVYLPAGYSSTAKHYPVL